MKQAFSGMENAVMASVSPWVKDRARKSPITGNLPHETVLNGVNTKLFRHYESHDLRQKYQIPESTKVIFHPTANFSAAEADRKGGRHVIELAKGFLGQDVLFLVAGKHPKDLDVPENMRLLGYIGDQKTLAEYYALSDVTVVAGERETFNMPVAESLCCGTPVAGFYAGGPESIALEGYSRFCEYGRPELLYHCVKDLLAQRFHKETVSAQAVGRYKAENMAEGYLAIYKKLLEKGTNTL